MILNVRNILNDPARRRWLVVLLVSAPLALVLACLGLAALSAGPVSRWAAARASDSRPLIPVTSEDTLYDPSPTLQAEPDLPVPDMPVGPEATAVPNATAVPGATAIPSPTAVPGQPADDKYLAVVDDLLSTCWSSFDTFYQLEQLAFHDPNLFFSERWRADAAAATAQFRGDCDALNDLPSPSGPYAEIDRMVKMAAGEAIPAADTFEEVILASEQGILETSKLHITILHMIAFVEYTQNAEDLIDGMQNLLDI